MEAASGLFALDALSMVYSSVCPARLIRQVGPAPVQPLRPDPFFSNPMTPSGDTFGLLSSASPSLRWVPPRGAPVVRKYYSGPRPLPGGSGAFSPSGTPPHPVFASGTVGSLHHLRARDQLRATHRHLRDLFPVVVCGVVGPRPSRGSRSPPGSAAPQRTGHSPAPPVSSPGGHLRAPASFLQGGPLGVFFFFFVALHSGPACRFTRGPGSEHAEKPPASPSAVSRIHALLSQRGGPAATRTGPQSLSVTRVPGCPGMMRFLFGYISAPPERGDYACAITGSLATPRLMAFMSTLAV
ncbi:hypothetical protein NDU88_002591 [Pleurodeles waltl]|uniref:Uncharacterized protein n=1 Tax=Pleurodeles waltl TaxID=8319 RepID=A0AAV7M6F7_PLEWA|nr:hypothetical protein NDU88_002591 [Pleurodeles waltl]